MTAFPNADAINKADISALLQDPAFRRFLFRIVETSGICAAAYGTEEHLLHREGARSLGLEILRWVSEAHPMPEHPGVPVLALLTILGEANRTDPTIKENASGRRTRYDRNAELGADDSDRAD